MENKQIQNKLNLNNNNSNESTIPLIYLLISLIIINFMAFIFKKWFYFIQ